MAKIQKSANTNTGKGKKPFAPYQAPHPATQARQKTGSLKVGNPGKRIVSK